MDCRKTWLIVRLSDARQFAIKNSKCEDDKERLIADAMAHLFTLETCKLINIKSPDQTEFFSREKKHMCSSPIQELYLVLRGTLNLDVDDNSLTVK
jgi:hypothetical protein